MKRRHRVKVDVKGRKLTQTGALHKRGKPGTGGLARRARRRRTGYGALLIAQWGRRQLIATAKGRGIGQAKRDAKKQARGG